jgi:hypothetical protein
VKIGDGRTTFLWYDHWHPDGCLLNKYGPQIIYEAASTKEAKVSSIMQNGEWFWAGARSDNVAAIQTSLSELIVEGGVDVPVWNSKSGIYKCVDAWESLRSKQPVVPWWRVVWFNFAIPRHAFLLWLTFKNALLTRDRLCAWGITGSMDCLFCHASQESRDHLFFECSVSRRIWRDVMGSCLISDPKLVWDEVVEWFSSELKGKNLAVSLCKLCFAATVYHLWRHRNGLLHGNTPRSEEIIVANVKWDVRTKILATGSVFCPRQKFTLLQNWSL